ncbi:hypothetical protein [Streptomyces mirabilis]
MSSPAARGDSTRAGQAPLREERGRLTPRSGRLVKSYCDTVHWGRNGWELTAHATH